MKFTQNNQLSIIHLFREYTNCKFIHKKTLTGCKPQYFSSKMFGYFWYGICLPHTEHMSWDGYITSILESWESTDYIIDDIFIAYRYVVCMHV